MSDSVEVVVVGAGLAGISASRRLMQLGTSHALIEASSEPGGLARSFRVNGFAFDCSGHLLHLRDPKLRRDVLSASPEGSWLEIARISHILLDGALIRYPIQANLVDATPRVREECLEGLPTEDPDGPPSSFGQWIDENLGTGLGRWFMRPYNEKLYGVSVDELAPSAIGRFLPAVDREAIRRGALEAPESGGYNAQFLYPAAGGIDLLFETLLREAADPRLGDGVVAIDPEAKVVTLADGSTQAYERGIVCSAPLPQTLEMASLPPMPALRARAVTCVNLGFRRIREDYEGTHWIYLPEPRFHAYRIGFYSHLCPQSVPAGMQSVYVEIAHWGDVSDDEALRMALADVSALGLIEGPADVVASVVVQVPDAYVVLDHAHAEATATARAALAECGIHQIGRYGLWEYGSMEEAIHQGVNTVDALITAVEPAR